MFNLARLGSSWVTEFSFCFVLFCFLWRNHCTWTVLLLLTIRLTFILPYYNKFSFHLNNNMLFTQDAFIFRKLSPLFLFFFSLSWVTLYLYLSVSIKSFTLSWFVCQLHSFFLFQCTNRAFYFLILFFGLDSVGKIRITQITLHIFIDFDI